MYLNLDSEVTERESYSLLEWLGDIGGLLDALRYIGGFLVAPIASFSLSSDLLASIFKRKKYAASTQRSSKQSEFREGSRKISNQ